jgi:hypothetical protein
MGNLGGEASGQRGSAGSERAVGKPPAPADRNVCPTGWLMVES